MAQSLIGDIDEELKERLRERPRRNGRSMGGGPRNPARRLARRWARDGSGTEIASRFKGIGLREGEEIPEL